jgi:hypothetical protein
MGKRFVVDRGDLHRIRWVNTASAALADGEVRMHVDCFALTSNNITYAAFGDAMNYWGFFPTGEPSTGCIPVWGFARVAESRCAGVERGERFYGYWPIGDEAVLQPARVNDASHEAEQALLRPLFMTSFLIDDFLADNQFFGARTVVLSSASSKTAYGTAYCLAQRRGSAEVVKVVGLTSAPNLAFTQSLGCYDEVLTYDAVRSGLARMPSVYVDFSGSVAVRADVHAHLADQLTYSCSVGGTHWEELGGGKGLPGPRPVLFFAPAQIKKRVADWGGAGLQQRLAVAWAAFMKPVTDTRQPWLQVVRGQGEAAVEACYATLLGGRIKPQEGHILSL